MTDKTDNRFYREAGDCKCKRLGDWDGQHHPLCDGPDATIAEPVAVVGQDFQLLYCRQNWSEGLKVGMPLYTHPASQPKALTDDPDDGLLQSAVDWVQKTCDERDIYGVAYQALRRYFEMHKKTPPTHNYTECALKSLFHGAQFKTFDEWTEEARALLEAK